MKSIIIEGIILTVIYSLIFAVVGHFQSPVVMLAFIGGSIMGKLSMMGNNKQ